MNNKDYKKLFKRKILTPSPEWKNSHYSYQAKNLGRDSTLSDFKLNLIPYDDHNNFYKFAKGNPIKKSFITSAKRKFIKEAKPYKGKVREFYATKVLYGKRLYGKIPEKALKWNTRMFN